jgi:hypothetical protein
VLPEDWGRFWGSRTWVSPGPAIGAQQTFGEDAFAAGALVRRFHDRKTNELAEPACTVVLWISGLDHGRQVFEKLAVCCLANRLSNPVHRQAR